MSSRWSYVAPAGVTGTATLGFDTANQQGQIQLPDCSGNITVIYAYAGTTASNSFDLWASHDGTNWVLLDDDVAGEEKIDITGPYNYIRTKLTAVSTTDDIIVTVGWIV